jgi:hypothetical protein
MSSCPYADRCAIRLSSGIESELRVWQGFYCDGSFARCERYKLARSGLDVPARLLPNGRLLDGDETTAPGASKRAG